MKNLIIIAAIIIGASCVKTEAPPADRSFASVDDLPIRWSVSTGSAPINLKISDEFDNDAGFVDNTDGVNPFELAYAQWDDVINTVDFLPTNAVTTTNKGFAEGYDDLGDYNDGELGIYKRFVWFPEVSSSALAITQFYGARRNVGFANEYIQITHADIIFNYDDHQFNLDDSVFTQFDTQTVVLHEIGHFLGLGHITGASAVMEPSLGAFETKRTLFAADRGVFEENYNVSGFALPLTSGKGATRQQGQFAPSNPGEGEVVRGIIELHADGSCHHSINGKHVHSH